MNYQNVANEILNSVGGSQNIKTMTHCATRLRLIVVSRELIKDEDVENIEGVKGVFFNSGQYQIILGTGTVNKVYQEMLKIGVKESTPSVPKEVEVDDNINKFKKIIRVLGDVFVPIIPVIVATGLMLGLKGLLFNPDFLALFGASVDSIPAVLITLTNILSETTFAFLPVFVCWSAIKVFGGSPSLGILLGLILVSPHLPNAYVVADPNSGVTPIMLFDFIPIVGYQGSIIPALMTGALAAAFEKRIRNVVPDSIDLIVSPFITMIVMTIISLLVIGPIFHEFEGILLAGASFLLQLPLGIGGFIIGFLWMPIVVTGVHHVFNVLEISLLSATGFNPFNAIISMAAISQGAVALAIGIRARKKQVKSIAMPSALSCWLGICEPAIFGVNLRYIIKPFIIGNIAAGIGGMLAMLIGLQGTANGVTGIPGILLYIYDGNQLLFYIGLSLFVAVIAFVGTWKFGIPKEAMEIK